MLKRTRVSSLCSVKRGDDFEISRLLAHVYDAYIMTGAILDDTHRVCQFSLFRRAVGGGTRGKLYASYADLMTGLMIVTTYCGSLSIVFTAGGGSLRTLQYHKNLHITPCGCKLSTYKKTGRKILRILTKKSQKYTMLSAKKIKCYTFWDQNHTGFTVKKSNICSIL